MFFNFARPKIVKFMRGNYKETEDMILGLTGVKINVTFESKVSNKNCLNFRFLKNCYN